MNQDDTFTSISHPLWCDPSCCTIIESHPYGAHQSASQVIPADPPVETVVELHLVSTMRGIAPQTLLMLELDLDRDPDRDATAQFGYAAKASDDPAVYPMTLRQARNLHAALGKLLTTLDEVCVSQAQTQPTGRAGDGD